MNKEQTTALQAVKDGKNIFLTGAGGTGKSYTINAIVAWAKEADILTAVTAMTGCAALLLNGRTLHSWSGIGLGRQSPSMLSAIVEKNAKARRNWCDTKLLIIDEISMITPELLEKLDHVARRVRKEVSKPFSGLQLVLSGDFCQLPPINIDRFAFETPIWPTLIGETHTLTQIERQRDPTFQRILTEARMGAVSQESLAILKSRVGLDWTSSTDGIRPTLIYSRNTDVDKINRANMDALVTESRIFHAETVYKNNTTKVRETVTDADLHRIDADAQYEPVLELKVGAQVMLIKNQPERSLMNGSRGVITGFSPSGLPMVRFRGTGSFIIERVSWFLPHQNVGRSQIPLKIAYAITIHKSQGASLDSALIDIGNSIFEYGQAYVALSRVRTLEGLFIHRLQPTAIVCHPKVRGFYQSPSDAA